MTSSTPATDTAPLSDIARQVAECYAVLHPERPSRSKAMKWLNKARKAATGVKGIVSAEMTEAVEELVAADILAPSIVGEHGVRAAGPGMILGSITRFCEDAVERGTAVSILEGLDKELYRPSWQRAPALPEHIEQHVRLALMTDAFARFADAALPGHVWVWLTEPRAKRWLVRLPERERRQACAMGLRWLAHVLQPIDAFADTCLELAPGATRRLLIARARVLQGRFDEARDGIRAAANATGLDRASRMECEALRATIGLLTGDDAAAHEAIASAIEIERDGSRKRILYPACASFTLALPALIRLGTPGSRALFASLLDARRKLKLQSDLDLWLFAAEAAGDPRADALPLYGRGAPTETDAFLAIASRWNPRCHFRRDDEWIIAALRELVLRADAGGYAWFVAELQTVLEAAVSAPGKLPQGVRDFLATRSAADRHAALGSTSLIPLVRPVEPWEHALRQLEQLAAASRPVASAKAESGTARSKRLVWQVEDAPYEGAVAITPLEQTRQKNGRWTGGRRVALKRLMEQASGLDHLDDQDRRACQTIRKILPTGWYGGSPSYETDERTLHRLAGHPLVIDVDGNPVEVVEAAPEIHVERTGDVARLTVRPRWSGKHYQSAFDTVEGRLEVTHFTAAHRRIAEAMPPGGLTLPKSAGQRLDDLLGALSGDIAVHGDGGSASETARPGDPDTVLVLEPAGDGLRVRLRVEPLAGSGSFFDAGTGGETVYVRTPDGPVTVRRDLAAEDRCMQALVGDSEVLTARFDGRPAVTLDDTVDALELLDDVQRTGMRCIWPGEIPFRLKARAGTNQVSLKLTSAKDWFAADGELAIEGGESIALARLLQLMRTRPGSRFVELGQGEFLALSATLKQQLDTLQAFSQPGPKRKDGDDDARRVHPMAVLALDELIDEATVKSDAA